MAHESKRLTLLSLRTLDAMLPRRVRHWSTGDRFRARSAALILLIGGIAVVLHVLQLHWEKAEGVLLKSGYVFLILIALFLLALKLVPRPQLIGSAYIAMLSLITFWFTGMHARSVFAESFYWLPNLILALYLVSGPRLASAMAGSIIAMAMMLTFYLERFEWRHPFDVTFEKFTVRIASTLLLCNASILLLVVAFLALTRANRRMWKQEKEWQLQAARMRELSELAASAALLMEQPLQNLQAQHAALVAGSQDAGEDERILREMVMDLQQVTRISESFALLARPRQDEEAEQMDAGIWLQHLTHIVLRRVAEKSWDLQIRYEPRNLMIQGPLGRLSMLIVLCLQEPFMNPAPEPGSPLLLTLKGYRDHVMITMEYKLPQQLLKTDDPVTESLVEELLNSMAAVIRRTQTDDKITIIIHGPWHDLHEQHGLIPES
jgi:hypothetical protein